MDLVQELKRVFDVVCSRITSFLQTAPPGTIQVTGVLGLAALVVGYYQFRGNDNSNNRAATRGADGSASSSAAAARSTRDQAGASTSATKPSSKTAAAVAELQGLSSTARAVRAQLAGVRKLTISAPGVLLEQIVPSQLQDAATIQPGVEELLKEVSSFVDVYLITHVEDDIGQAVVQGVLDAHGLVGTSAGCIKQHKVLFCSTSEGKISMVRQLEPDLHIDAAAATIQELKRFMPQLLHITCGGQAAAVGAPNVGHSASLAAFFG